ncbi:MAG: (2Fe-2S)-binding protein [Candidatus Lambdaproteobacteria bacterium]|nr:(2Fe-2S)-binding protein [Candidatus Lambdaproteobacteria bacterium]
MKQPLRLTVNGQPTEALVSPGTSLLTFLRETCGLTGPKRGCEEGECGCCAVLLDGKLVDSCLIFALEAEGAEVLTVEGLRGDAAGRPDHLAPVQQAFAEAGASQCGFCMPGMLLATASLLERNPAPGDDEIRRAISGNLCRCTGYTPIVKAIRLAAALKRQG